MPPKRTNVSKSRTKKRSSRNSNPHNIIFGDEGQAKRYSVFARCKVTPSRYMCEQTLSDLGLRYEVDRMFHVIWLLKFMHFEASIFERITLVFMSTLDFQLQRKWLRNVRYYFGTLKFCLFNENHELTLKSSKTSLSCPSTGPTMSQMTFWWNIFGLKLQVVLGTAP